MSWLEEVVFTLPDGNGQSLELRRHGRKDWGWSWTYGKHATGVEHFGTPDASQRAAAGKWSVEEALRAAVQEYEDSLLRNVRRRVVRLREAVESAIEHEAYRKGLEAKQ